MQTEDNKAIVERFFEEVLNGKNLDVVDEVFNSNHVLQDPNLGEEKQGSAVMAALARLFHVLVDELQVDVEHTVAEGDMVATSWTVRGKTADSMGDPDLIGNELMVFGTSIFIIDNGKISETQQLFRSLEYYPRPEPKEEALRERLDNDPLLAPLGRAARGLKCWIFPRTCHWAPPDLPE